MATSSADKQKNSIWDRIKLSKVNSVVRPGPKSGNGGGNVYQ